jgi:8-oxo-dGTP diphosphatase
MLVAAHLLLKRNEEIIIARRFQTGYEDGNYSLPAGHVDEGESMLAALIREAREEIGIELRMADLQPVHVSHRHGDGRIGIDFFVLAEKWQGEPHNAEPDKCDDVRWCHWQQLPDNTIPYIRSAIQHWQHGLWYSEFGWE